METFVLHEKIASPSPSNNSDVLVWLEADWTLTAAGTTELIDVAAGDTVILVSNCVGTTAPDQNIEVGDAGDVDRYATAGTVSAGSVKPYTYAAADTIDIKAASSTSEGGGTLRVLLRRA